MDALDDSMIEESDTISGYISVPLVAERIQPYQLALTRYVSVSDDVIRREELLSDGLVYNMALCLFTMSKQQWSATLPSLVHRAVLVAPAYKLDVNIYFCFLLISGR